MNVVERTCELVSFPTHHPWSGGAGGDDAYLGEGLTDEMIVRLGQLDPLRLGVIARTSARRFAAEGHDAGDARALLGADFVLEGSVRREGDRVRVSAASTCARR